MDYQETFGAMISAPDIRDYHLATIESSFPEEFELLMPAVKNQGTVGSCVAHAIATVMEYYNEKQHKQTIPMSVGYIYGNRVSSDYRGEGMYLREALKDACKEGNVIYTDLPANIEVPEIFWLVGEKKEILAPRVTIRTTSYVRVTNEQEIKTALLNECPVVFVIPWYLDTIVVRGVVKTSKKVLQGHHCMVIYGWDKKGWKIQNSWGTLWGDGGRATLPYDTEITQAFSVIDELVGDIEIKKPYKDAGALVTAIIRIINNILGFFTSLKYKPKINN